MQLMTQWVKDEGGGSCLAFWDLGSQVSLVTTQYARERILEQMGRSSLKLSGLGSGTALKATYKYRVTLVQTDGQKVELIAHGLENIASNLDAIDPESEEGIPRGPGRRARRSVREGQPADQPRQPPSFPHGD